ncbi:MAG TPA: hypothetical protein VFF74_08875 [Methylophilaceae bacterium]|nr:hypothetical protein [Methylophilaceae bacterium]
MYDAGNPQSDGLRFRFLKFMKSIITSGKEFKSFVSDMEATYRSVVIESFNNSLLVDGEPLMEIEGCVAIESYSIKKIEDASTVKVGGFIILGQEKQPFILQNAFHRWQKGVIHPRARQAEELSTTEG